MDQELIERIVEAALLAAGQPLTVAQLYALFPDDQPAPADSIEKALQELRKRCEGRGVELVEVASGFRYQIQTDVHAWVTRLWTERQTRYTRATLETLSLIAYRQPITRGEIEQIRGVAVNSNIIKMLEEREWIRVVGYRDVPGKPALFGTTRAFLDYFNLKSLDQLPPLAELHDIPDLEPQLEFEPKLRDATDVAIPASIPATASLDDESSDDAIDALDEGAFDGSDIAEANADASDPDAVDLDASARTAATTADPASADLPSNDSPSDEISSDDDSLSDGAASAAPEHTA
jgi:segregation and condensation protein B